MAVYFLEESSGGGFPHLHHPQRLNRKWCVCVVGDTTFTPSETEQKVAAVTMKEVSPMDQNVHLESCYFSLSLVWKYFKFSMFTVFFVIDRFLLFLQMFLYCRVCIINKKMTVLFWFPSIYFLFLVLFFWLNVQ